MTISSYGYPDQIAGVLKVDAINYAKIWEQMGHFPIVETAGALAGTALTGRTVRCADGWASGKGIVDNFAGPPDVVLPADTGTRYYAVIIRRNWVTGRTTLAYIGGGTTAVLPGGLNNNPGALHDTPLHLWAVTGNGLPVFVQDYRVTRAEADIPLMVMSNLRTKTNTQHINATTTTPVNSWETLAGLDAVYSTGGPWVYNSGVWTLPATGIWTASATVHHDAADFGTVGVRFVRSGTVVVHDTRANNNNPAGVNISGQFYATAGQTVTVQAWSSDGNGQDMGASAGGSPAQFALTATVPSY